MITAFNGVTFEFVPIKAGSFKMGTRSVVPGEKPKHIEVSPEHKVKIGKPFQLGKHEVTMEQWDAFMERNPSRRQSKGAKLPLDSVSWEEVQEFLKRLNTKEPGHLYRLPTEAEWEYACRAGRKGEFLSNLNESSWWEGNSGNSWKNRNQPGEVLEGPKMPLPVGGKGANAWGLHDMQGNVWEWVQDWYGPYSVRSEKDPAGPATGDAKVFKGGSWLSWGFSKTELQPWYRDYRKTGFRHTDLGFRLARTVK
ncbi:MAG: formylglycine-generating enzyme family protein [Acidobacteria bacterium]|nr:formylglycine-generating enzyme family protein [Acidobacteriota bacterium]